MSILWDLILFLKEYNQTFYLYLEIFFIIALLNRRTLMYHTYFFKNSSFLLGESSLGFEADDNFDSFLAAHEPPAVPQSTPSRFSRAGSAESDENDKDFNIFIKWVDRGLYVVQTFACARHLAYKIS